MPRLVAQKILDIPLDATAKLSVRVNLTFKTADRSV